MRKFFHQIHLWLSIPLGLFISIICFTGAILVLEKPITRMVYPETQIQQADAQQAQGNRNGRPADAQQAQGNRHGRPADAQQAQGNQHGPQAGPQTKRQSLAFFRQVRTLHRWLLNAPAQRGEQSAGKLIVGITTVALVVILVSGLVIWFPRQHDGLKKRLQVSCSKGWPRFWHDTHVALGFYCTLFLLIMALTGLTWSFRGYRTFVYTLFGDPQGQSLRGFFYSLHTGSWGGVVTQIIYFIAALIGGTLPLTGYYLWWKKRKRK